MIGQSAPTSAIDALAARLARMEERIADLQRTVVPSRTFTPALTSTGTPPSLGSLSSLAGDFQIVNGRCHWWANVTIAGTGVAAGSGSYRFTLPASPAALTGGFRIVGAGWWYHSGGFSVVTVDASPGGTTARLIVDGGEVTASYPAAPTNGSVLSLSGSFPIA